MKKWSIVTCTLTLALIAGLPCLPQASNTCDDTAVPIVFVHGLLASGDTWTTQIQRFASNGHCQDRYFVFDWNTLSTSGADALLDKFIDSVRNVTGVTQVHLVGHSAGGGRGYSYLSDPNRAAKILSYAHIASATQSGPAGPGGSVPTLNIYSTVDEIVAGADIAGAQNIQFTTFDHYQVATSKETFSALYSFFYGTSPNTTTIAPTDVITIGGKCLTLGENTPTNGAIIEVFQADSTGKPADLPVATFNVSASGFWGPLEVESDKYHLFKISSNSPSFRKVIYYYEPFVRDNPTVYLRTFPPAFSLAGLLLSSIPNNDNQSVVSIFTSTQAVIHGRDNLTLDGLDLATADLASASASMIALFCYDDGNDGLGNGESMSNFAAFPFLKGADIPLTPSPEKTIHLLFNGSSIPVRNWRSKSDGVVIAVFNEPDQAVSAETLSPESLGSINVYPNPAYDQIWVEGSHTFYPGDKLSIIGPGGQILQIDPEQIIGNRFSVGVSDLPIGTYALLWESKTGRAQAKFQVIR
ncbi:MAG: alpha/beta fold hydrolase [Saprospiraceae bacterium]|nr:alpha/beta fold hydrolase [Saprospiraceae bacterium]